jgi:hypothetical protein
LQDRVVLGQGEVLKMLQVVDASFTYSQYIFCGPCFLSFRSISTVA